MLLAVMTVERREAREAEKEARSLETMITTPTTTVARREAREAVKEVVMMMTTMVATITTQAGRREAARSPATTITRMFLHMGQGIF